MQHNRKLLVLYDFLAAKGGAERVHFELCDVLDAFGIVGYVDELLFPALDAENQLSLQAYSRVAPLRMARLVHAFRALKARLDPAQPKIFSGSYSVLAHDPASTGRSLYYCHTPPRFLYDLRDHYGSEFGVGMRLGLHAFSTWLQPRYELAVRSMDVVLANSETTRARLQQYLGIDAKVVYPPVDIERFKWLSDGDYFVSTARHEPLKRVDIVIQAFKQMPDRKLVVASGGSRTVQLQALANGYENIVITGWQSDEALANCVGHALATIYVATDEDFGMSPVESMAAGKPVIGVDEGGLRETIVDGVTGIFVTPQLGVDTLTEAVSKLTHARASRMRADCERRAADYSRERFFSDIRAHLE